MTNSYIDEFRDAVMQAVVTYHSVVVPRCGEVAGRPGGRGLVVLLHDRTQQLPLAQAPCGLMLVLLVELLGVVLLVVLVRAVQAAWGRQAGALNLLLVVVVGCDVVVQRLGDDGGQGGTWVHLLAWGLYVLLHL